MARAHDMQIMVGPDGRLSFLYDDALAGLLGEGSSSLRRASHVEPEPGLVSESSGFWTVDLSPSGGPPCAGRFGLRRDALAFERAWLEADMREGAPA